MIQNIFCDQTDSFRGHKSLFSINIPNFLVIDVRVHIHGLDVIHTEGKYIFIIDRIHNGICVELIAEGLLCGSQRGILTHTGIGGKDGGASESEQMVFLEILGDCLVHITELAAVAFVENNDNTLIEYAMTGILLDEGGQFLDGGDDDLGAVILQLAF